MRAVVKTGPGEVQLNWMWLPTFCGVNTVLKAELDKVLSKRLVGQPLDDATLDMAHEEVINLLEQKFPEIQGLREYLDAMKFVASS